MQSLWPSEKSLQVRRPNCAQQYPIWVGSAGGAMTVVFGATVGLVLVWRVEAAFVDDVVLTEVVFGLWARA